MRLTRRALDVEINLDESTKGINESEMSKLVESHWLIQEARDAFLNQEMTWEQYLELVASHNLNMDIYLKTVEDNLQDIGLIV